MGMLLRHHYDPQHQMEEAIRHSEAHAVDAMNRPLAKGRWKRGVVYMGTPNLYEQMVTAAKSMLYHNPNVTVYFLIEDDVFPYELPDCVICVNVRKQPWFRPSGPNYNNPWTHMILLRTALTKLFPEYDRILSIDVDTIVRKDISELFTMNMGDNYVAAACERFIDHSNPNYFNVGVLLVNLKLWRESGYDDQLIDLVNQRKYRCPEQDAMMELFGNKFIELDCKYNDNFACGESGDPSIIHYIGKSKRNHKLLYIRSKYEAMDWSTIVKNRTVK